MKNSKGTMNHWLFIIIPIGLPILLLLFLSLDKGISDYSFPLPPASLERYPSVETQERVAVGKEFSVVFSLTEEQLTPEARVVQGEVTEAGKLRMELPGDAGPWDLDVVLLARGFSLRGPDAASIRLPRSGDSSAARFRLVAEPISGVEVERPLFLTLWHQGTYLGRVARSVKVVQADAVRTALPITPGEPSRSAAPKERLALDLRSRPADLTLLLVHDTTPDHRRVATLLIESPHLQASRQKMEVPAETQAWLERQYAALAGWRRNARGQVVHLTGGSGENAVEPGIAFAKGLGRTLYERLAPEAFKTAFWQLRDRLGPDFASIQILTDDPLLPWELMRPVRGAEEADFLGIELRVARWHLSEAPRLRSRPPQRVSLRRLAAIQPRYTDAPLPHADEEMDALRRFPGIEPVRGDYGAVSRVLTAQDLEGIIHFAGHGLARPTLGGGVDYAIRLEDRELDLMTLRGLLPQQPGEHALIFLNACEIGQAQVALNFVDGWAPALLEAGASGYLGGLWPLGDRGAAGFAKRFYAALEQQLDNAQGALVADLLRTARRGFYETADPTFLGYVYYGDPNLAVRRPGR